MLLNIIRDGNSGRNSSRKILKIGFLKSFFQHAHGKELVIEAGKVKLVTSIKFDHLKLGHVA